MNEINPSTQVETIEPIESIMSTTPTPENQASSSSSLAAPNTDISAPTAEAGSPVWKSTPYLISGALALLLAVQWLNTHNQIDGLTKELAKRLQSVEINNSEVKTTNRAIVETTREVQAKVTLLEGKQAEAQGQQLALEQLYQDLSKNRDEWALAEIEQVLATASQQLQLAGNVQGALIALQNADSRLAKSEKAQFILVRRAIAKDIERLKALPILDLTGVVLRLDTAIQSVDTAPLWSDEKAPTEAIAPKAPLRVLPNLNKSKSGQAQGKEAEYTLSEKLQDRWQSFSAEMWTELKQLVRVRSVKTPDALFVSPTQAYFVKENLKLRLLNARLALLSRNENVFQNDIKSAQDIIEKYFDERSKQTVALQSMLTQIQNNKLSIEMPALTESLNSIRNFKVKP